jgi:hypothetical protein
MSKSGYYSIITDDPTTQSLLDGCHRLAIPFQLFSPYGPPYMCSHITAFKNLRAVTGILPQTFPPVPTNRGSMHGIFREGFLDRELAHYLSKQFGWVRESLEKYSAAYRPSFEVPELQVMDTTGHLLREHRGAGTVHPLLQDDELLSLLDFVLDRIEKGAVL